MASQFQFELASPEKMLVNKNVAMVAVPSEKGLYGVLPGHAPMITTVKPGVVEVYENDDVTITDRIFVESGFAEVTETRCTVLAGKAVPVAKLDKAQIDSEIKFIEMDMAKAETEEDHAVIESRMVIARAKLQALS